MKHNKKAQIQQIVYFMVLIFTIAITILISKVIFNEFDDALERGDMHTTESRKALRDMDTAFPTLDNAILMILILLTVGLIITSFFIPTHPIFMFINVIGIFVLCFLGMILSNLYRDIIINSDQFLLVYGSFTKMNFIMNQLPWIAAIIIFIVTIIQYTKFQSGG